MLVYIAEAHATDEWNISSARDVPSGNAVAIPQHKCHADRIRAAEAFVAEFGWERGAVVLDTMDDAFQQQYRPWPLGMYVIAADGQLVHKTLDDFEDLEFMQCMEALKTACE